MKHFSTFLILLLLSTFQLFAYNNIWVGDVRNVWWTEQGIISDYYLKVHPAGVYAKCELTLEFDAEMLSFNPSDSLEIQMNFDLPEGAIVTDLWLWIFGQAEQADIHDRWTASLIYESIVQRRIDPAILTKNWGDSYNLKVFPIMTDMPRKVKIEYIVPVNTYGAQYYSVPLPLNFAQMSALWPGTTNVYFEGGTGYTNPSIGEMPNLRFKDLYHPDDGLCYGTRLGDSSISSDNLTLTYVAKSKSLVSVGYDKTLDENFFELNMNPSEFFELKDGKKTVFLIDFIEENSDYNGEELLAELRSAILQNFDDTDSINLMFSGILAARASNNWIACTDSVINALFDNISAEFFNSYSNLPPLLSDGVSFIQNNGGTGNMVLISSGHENGSRAEANGLITDLMSLIENDQLPIHVINLDNYYSHYIDYYIGGVYYRGNEYLYKHLSQRTGADYLSVNNNNLSYLLTETCSKLNGYFKNISIEVEFENGYTYSVFDLYSTNTMRYFNDNVRLVGKYMGTLPIKVKGHAQKSSGEVISNTRSIDADGVSKNNNEIKQVWASQLINELKSLPASNMVMSSIIETSIEYRVLCDYSAFLVLEPGFVPDLDWNEEQPLVDEMGWGTALTNEVIEDKLNTLSNYPNPVTTQTTFKYSVHTSGHVELKLLNSSGQLLEVLLDEEKPEGEYELNYNAAKLPEGMYLYVLLINGESIQQNKMIVVK